VIRPTPEEARDAEVENVTRRARPGDGGIEIGHHLAVGNLGHVGKVRGEIRKVRPIPLTLEQAGAFAR
jgi:hypothetical protein